MTPGSRRVRLDTRPMSKPDIQSMAREPGEGPWVENPLGGTMTFKLSAEESGGRFTVVESVAGPGEGPPLHIHPEDELIYVLEESLRVRLDETLLDAAAGSFVFIPRGRIHTWLNAGDLPVKFLALLMPASPAFETLFKSYADLPVEERGEDAFVRLAKETRAFEVVGPSLTHGDAGPAPN